MVRFSQIFGKEETLEKKVYLTQPSILYHTKTEDVCKSYLRGHFEARVQTPLDFRSKPRSFFERLMKESEAVVGTTIEDVYTYPVWQDLEYANQEGKPFFTLRVLKVPEGRSLDLQLVEGMADFERLSWEDTQALYYRIQKKQLGVPLLFGRAPEY